MRVFRLDLSAPADWAALCTFAKLAGQPHTTGPIEPADFMYAGRLVRRSVDTIFLYKHRKTRAYLCIDRQGYTYKVAACEGKIIASVLESPSCAITRALGRVLPSAPR